MQSTKVHSAKVHFGPLYTVRLVSTDLELHLAGADGAGLAALQPLEDAGQVVAVVALRLDRWVLCQAHGVLVNGMTSSAHHVGEKQVVVELPDHAIRLRQCVSADGYAQHPTEAASVPSDCSGRCWRCNPSLQVCRTHPLCSSPGR